MTLSYTVEIVGYTGGETQIHTYWGICMAEYMNSAARKDHQPEYATTLVAVVDEDNISLWWADGNNPNWLSELVRYYTDHESWALQSGELVYRKFKPED